MQPDNKDENIQIHHNQRNKMLFLKINMPTEFHKWLWISESV